MGLYNQRQQANGSKASHGNADRPYYRRVCSGTRSITIMVFNLLLRMEKVAQTNRGQHQNVRKYCAKDKGIYS